MPRAGLTPAQVVAEAAAAADEVGFDRLTLAMVAKRLGVRLPSLYNHLESLDALRRHLAVMALQELAAELAAAVIGRAGQDALHGLGRAYRRYALAHPGRYAATVRAPDPEDTEHTAAAQAVLDVVLAVLRGYHLEGPDAVDATRSMRAALHGWADLERNGAFAMPQDVEISYHRLLEGFHTTLSLTSPPTPPTADSHPVR